MKWQSSFLILFIIVIFPLFQWDEASGRDWLIWQESQDFLINESELENLSSDLSLPFNPKTAYSHLFFINRSAFQWGNPLSFIYRPLCNASPLWRPPPQS